MNTVDEILNYAIDQEQIAADFYLATAEKAESAEMKRMLLEFADEELRHKQILLNVQNGERNLTPEQEVLDLKISDYLVEVDTTDSSITYQDALIIAMKREKAAFDLYDSMAKKLPAGNLKEVLEGLAIEESKHKLFFETQYDDYVMTHN